MSLERDPDHLSRHLAGTDLTDSRGRFVIPLDEFGSGWMDESWLIRATKQGYQDAVSTRRLSRYKDEQLLIIMATGATGDSLEGWQEQYQRFK